MVKAEKTKLVAVLDTNNRLVGTKRVGVSETGIDPGDLPTNGNYKYVAEKGAFFPIGTDFGKIKTRQPHSTEYVLFRMIKAFGGAGFELPLEAQEWLTWYDGAMKKRDEELSARPR